MTAFELNGERSVDTIVDDSLVSIVSMRFIPDNDRCEHSACENYLLRIFVVNTVLIWVCFDRKVDNTRRYQGDYSLSVGIIFNSRQFFEFSHRLST